MNLYSGPDKIGTDSNQILIKMLKKQIESKKKKLEKDVKEKERMLRNFGKPTLKERPKEDDYFNKLGDGIDTLNGSVRIPPHLIHEYIGETDQPISKEDALHLKNIRRLKKEKIHELVGSKEEEPPRKPLYGRLGQPGAFPAIPKNLSSSDTIVPEPIMDKYRSEIAYLEECERKQKERSNPMRKLQNMASVYSGIASFYGNKYFPEMKDWKLSWS